MLFTAFRPVLAQDTGMTPEQQSLMYNYEIRRFSVVDCPPGVSPAAAAAGSTAISADAEANLVTILQFFTSNGLSLAAAAGIAGNLKMESGFNPAIIQGGAIAPPGYIPVNSVGFGLAQWTFTSRQQPLVDLAASRGASVTDLGIQLDYMWQELNGGWISTLTALDAIKTDPVEAAVIFHELYEGSADSSAAVINNRGGAATAIYNQYQGQIADGTGVTGVAPVSSGTSAAGNSFCGTATNGSLTALGGATQPTNTETKGTGWSLIDGQDYSATACAPGTADTGLYTHPTRGFTIRLCDTNVGIVASIISQRVLDMINAAAQAGVTLSGSAFVTFDQQALKRANNCSNPAITSTCNPPTAPPGDSEHERGLAIDFNNAAAGGAVFNWLTNNAASIGLINLPSESWHWSMSGY